MTKPAKKELATIRFLAGPFAGKEFSITQKQLYIGRSREADLTVGDTLMSRKHLLLQQGEDGLWYVKDLKSSNGTWVGGREVKGRAASRKLSASACRQFPF